jgi:hypothetical protein
VGEFLALPLSGALRVASSASPPLQQQSKKERSYRPPLTGVIGGFSGISRFSNKKVRL